MLVWPINAQVEQVRNDKTMSSVEACEWMEMECELSRVYYTMSGQILHEISM